jgi:hypothetical protein
MTQQIDDKLLDDLLALNYNIEDALGEFLLLNLSLKISEFKSNCYLYRKKYSIDFRSSKEKIENRTEEENFIEYDDYMEWKFSEEQKECLENKLENVI